MYVCVCLCVSSSHPVCLGRLGCRARLTRMGRRARLTHLGRRTHLTRLGR